LYHPKKCRISLTKIKLKLKIITKIFFFLNATCLKTENKLWGNPATPFWLLATPTDGLEVAETTLKGQNGVA
jgi:hypothetical protein